MPKAKRRPPGEIDYALDKVTIRELFESRATREPSEKALRERAFEEILVFEETTGNTHYYDRVLSTIRVNAARRCKRPRVQWRHIRECLGRVRLTNEQMNLLLRDGRTPRELEDELAHELSGLLQQR